MATECPSRVRTAGQRRADSTTADDDDVHGRSVSPRGRRAPHAVRRAPTPRIVAIVMVSLAKRILIGRPIATSEEGHQRLRKRVALPIFASDAISSTAYATDEVVLVLAAAGGRRARRLRQARPHLHRRGDPADDRRAVVPPDDPRLPVGRRRLRRVAGEPRRGPVARRRRVAADRLHPHGRRVGGRWRAGDPVGVRLRQPVARPALPRHDRRDDGGQPARPEGVGLAVRPADVPLHRHADPADRRRLLPDLRPGHGPDPAREPVRGGPAPGDGHRGARAC